MNPRLLMQGLCLSCLVATPAMARVSAQEAAQLGGPTLTAFGAERAGNADGSIPAYSGPPPSPGISVGRGQMPPDPFPNDRVLYTVSSANMAQYMKLLTPGTVELLRKYPTFHLDVYQTRRTAGYPQWVLDNTRKNATTAELTGSIEGDGVTGAYGGVPFPIPKNGYEVLWNAATTFVGFGVEDDNGGSYFVDASGNVTLTNRSTAFTSYPCYDPSRSSLAGPFYFETTETTTAPAGEDGSKVILKLPINYSANDQVTYSYTIGQRRVRLAPEFKYDTPIAPTGGSFEYDEIGIFSGRPDRFDFRLAGKREVLIPYNIYKNNLPGATNSAWLTPHHPNPDMIRWEKHRVWVIEATLKPGQRHVYSRRTLFVDEDTWSYMSADAYDQSGHLYRVSFALPFWAYFAPYPVSYPSSLLYFNLDRGSYATSESFGGPNHGSFVFEDHVYNAAMYTPETMAGSGVR